MSKQYGANRRGTRQGSNPARVAAVQNRLRSGGYGAHKQATDRTRAEIEREAVEEYQDDLDA